MLERFIGTDGERLTQSLLLNQFVINGDSDIADAIMKVGRIVSFKKGHVIINQGATDNCLYLLLSGSALIDVNGSIIAERRHGFHVGEMSLIDPTLHRSATVIAAQDMVAFVLSESEFSGLASIYPNLWRRLAIELSRRLYERNKLIQKRNEKITLFIGSSSESLHISKKLNNLIESEPFDIRLWTIGVFEPSHFPLEDLLKQANNCDFAVFIVCADDMVTSRAKVSAAPRDNIVFETGLFMGATGRERTIMLAPKGVDIKIPSDLLGITMLMYDTASLDSTLFSIKPLPTF